MNYYLDEDKNVLIAESEIDEENLINISEEKAFVLLKGSFEKQKSEINEKAYKEIVLKYSEYKQLNIIRNKDIDLFSYTEMCNYIDNIRNNSNEEIEKLKQYFD